LAAAVKYVRTREGVYQYERRVPARIQRDTRRFADLFGSKKLYRKSLGTKNTSDMFAAARAAHDLFEKLVGERSSVPAVVVGQLKASRILCDDDLVAIADQYEQVTAEPFERMHRRADVNPSAAAELERMTYEFERQAESLAASLRSRTPDAEALSIEPHTVADCLVAEGGFVALPGSEERGAIIGAVRAGMERGYTRISSLIAGTVTPKLRPTLAPVAVAKGLTLADAVTAYIEGRKTSAKAISEIRLSLRQFEEVVGSKALNAITKSDVHTFLRHAASRVVGGRTEGSVVRPISETTLGKRLRMLGSVTNYARDTGSYEGDNPFVNIKVGAFAAPIDKVLMPDKRRFHKAELNSILNHPWFTGCRSNHFKYERGNHRLMGSYFWVPIVAMYTGCRASELGGLRVRDVVLEAEYPHIVVRDNEYRRTKSQRTRRVPILDALIAIGFQAYFREILHSGSDRVFPDWKPARTLNEHGDADLAWSNSGVIRAFNRNVVEQSLGGVLDTSARREVTFHSFRGSFKAMLGSYANVPTTYINEVVGHSKEELDQRYIGEISIEETYPLIHSCDYQGLILPTPPTG
jgi:integrase